ncbi:hydroxyacid dehydrogenase [Neolewinella lacunae]|uniref:Hydroxyacid dehydrogenase n=1 Tax=Neolewinella lacunae TaxID=1517758 RepID=A0A923T805_9BACT|nr:hydroxyacid dehydrogenase [Neolewinella lacunae]MBC6994074.1 hydroxyacid dehydrogenase [Neolewinella lacunae]MDN3636055.1 hydroxyacid dehydrogenase [Neolewinella lacunae]
MLLLLETVSESAELLLRQSARVVLAETPFSGPDEARRYDIEAIVTRGKGEVNAALLDLCPSLKVIARCGVGLDNIDVATATQRGIPVVNAPGVNAETVAEHTLGLMLSLQRQMFAAITATKAGNWAYRNSYAGDELRGKTLGIMGYGNIGQRVAKLATAFGMRVLHLAHPQVQAKDDGAMARDLPDLLAESDLLTIHLPLNVTTRQLLNAEMLARVKPGALLINTARGEIIDEAALLAGLQSGHLGGYAADVLTTQPPDPASPLLALPNVLITPHLASLTARTYDEMCVLTARNTLDVLHGKPIDRRFIHNLRQLNR